MENREESTVVALMLEQYRMTKFEEVVTKNVFRVIWFSIAIYSTSIDVTREFGMSIFLSEPIGLFVAGLVLFVISSRYSAHLRRQSLKMREMLVSLDPHLKDFYVLEIHREEQRLGITPGMASLLVQREEGIWFLALICILNFKIMFIYII